jgi:hypothetical protein
MKGLIKVTATKGGKTITSNVYGDLANKKALVARLMNRHKVLLRDRNLWKLADVKLIKEII